ncbi:hypothetical protein KY284_036295 [Solanum tuberosum]|nr:hypothetical protein KY284_036295 [Solanum tuberosum]
MACHYIDFLIANFEDNVMIALYWGVEIIAEMNGFRYNECARMIVSMSISTNYVESIKLLHEKMGTDGENIQLNISGKYPCSFQVNLNLMNARVVKDILRVATTNMKSDEATFDLCNDAHAQRSDENSEEDEPSEDDGESKAIESESDEDIGNLP